MKNTVRMIAVLALGLAFLWVFWMWGFCRFYVGPNNMGVITSKIGKPLPAGQILAEEGQKGIRREVLGEGRHFWNPIFYKRELRTVTIIEAGKVGIVTSKVGSELPTGEFLADGGEKGIWRGVIGPGKYRLNPYGFKIDTMPAISIPIGYAGVLTSLSGEQAPAGQFAAAGQKGVRQDILQPGLYYINSKQYKTDVLEIGVNQVSLLGREGSQVITKGQMQTQNVAMEQLQNQVLEEQKKKRFDYLSKNILKGRGQQTPAQQTRQQSGGQQSGGRQSAVRSAAQQEALDLERVKQEYLQADSMATLGLPEFVEFPSRDGFQISLDMTVEFELLPENIAWILSRYGDLPAVVDKIIMPQITSISRNKGSEYRAKDFIMGEGREKFQNDLTKALATTLGVKKLIVHNALIRHVVVPNQILEPIQEASIAVEEDLTNQEKQNTAKKQAELNTETTLIEQNREQVAQETEKIVAEIEANEQKMVAEIEAEAVRLVAEIDKDTALVNADKVRTLELARAKATKLVEGEKAKGLQLKAEAFKDPLAYSLFEFSEQLNPGVEVNLIHTGEGTLWTDLKGARLGDLGGAGVIQNRASSTPARQAVRTNSNRSSTVNRVPVTPNAQPRPPSTTNTQGGQ